MASVRKKISRVWGSNIKPDTSMKQIGESRCSGDSGYGNIIAECGSSYMPKNKSPFKNTIRKAASTTFQVFSNSLRSKTELFYVPPTVEDPHPRTPDGSPSKWHKQGTAGWSSVRRRVQLDKRRPSEEATTPDGFNSIGFDRPRCSHIERAPTVDLPIRTKFTSPKKPTLPCTDMPYEIAMDISKFPLIELQDPWLDQVGGSFLGADDAASDMEGHNRRPSDFSVSSQSTQATDRTHISWKGRSLFVTGRSMKSQRPASPYRMAKKELSNTPVEALSTIPTTESEIALNTACTTQLPQCDTAEDDIDGSTDLDDDTEPNLALQRVHCNGNTPNPLVIPGPAQPMSADSLAVLCCDDEGLNGNGDNVIGPKDPALSRQEPHKELQYSVETIEQRPGPSLDSVPDGEDVAISPSLKVPHCSQRALGSEVVFDEALSKTITVKEWMQTTPLHRLIVERPMSTCSDATTASCAVTTHSPQCYAPPPTPTHHRANPARSTSEVLQDTMPFDSEEGISCFETDMDVLQNSPKASTSAITAEKLVSKGRIRRDASTTDRRHVRKRSWRMRDSSGQDLNYNVVGSPRDTRQRSVSNDQKEEVRGELEGTPAPSPSRQYPIRNPSRYCNGEECGLPKQGRDPEEEPPTDSHHSAASQAYAAMVQDELDRLLMAHKLPATCMSDFDVAFQGFAQGFEGWFSEADGGRTS